MLQDLPNLAHKGAQPEKTNPLTFNFPRLFTVGEGGTGGDFGAIVVCDE